MEKTLNGRMDEFGEKMTALLEEFNDLSVMCVVAADSGGFVAIQAPDGTKGLKNIMFSCVHSMHKDFMDDEKKLPLDNYLFYVLAESTSIISAMYPKCRKELDNMLKFHEQHNSMKDVKEPNTFESLKKIF